MASDVAGHACHLGCKPVCTGIPPGGALEAGGSLCSMPITIALTRSKRFPWQQTLIRGPGKLWGVHPFGPAKPYAAASLIFECDLEMHDEISSGHRRQQRLSKTAVQFAVCLVCHDEYAVCRRAYVPLGCLVPTTAGSAMRCQGLDHGPWRGIELVASCTQGLQSA